VTIDDQAAVNDYIIIWSRYGLNAGAYLYYTYQKELGTSKGALRSSIGGIVYVSISPLYFTSIAFGHHLDAVTRETYLPTSYRQFPVVSLSVCTYVVIEVSKRSQ
jgi:hypothetical protein